MIVIFISIIEKDEKVSSKTWFDKNFEHGFDGKPVSNTKPFIKRTRFALEAPFDARIKCVTSTNN